MTDNQAFLIAYVAIGLCEQMNNCLLAPAEGSQHVITLLKTSRKVREWFNDMINEDEKKDILEFYKHYISL